MLTVTVAPDGVAVPLCGLTWSHDGKPGNNAFTEGVAENDRFAALDTVSVFVPLPAA